MVKKRIKRFLKSKTVARKVLKKPKQAVAVVKISKTTHAKPKSFFKEEFEDEKKDLFFN